jgi:hypothetical protein
VLVEMILDPDSWFVVRNTPGVTSFVGGANIPGVRNEPIPLDETEVKQILRQMGVEAPKFRVAFTKGQRSRERKEDRNIKVLYTLNKIDKDEIAVRLKGLKEAREAKLKKEQDFNYKNKMSAQLGANGKLSLQELKPDTLNYSDLSEDMKKSVENISFSIHRIKDDNVMDTSWYYNVMMNLEEDTALVRSDIKNRKIIKQAVVMNFGKEAKEINTKLNDFDGMIRSSDINSLIPIAINTKKNTPLYILWFEPSEELLKILPQEAGNQIQKEKLTLNTSESLCETGSSFVKEESYFDVWYGCSGSVKDMKAFPNPARNFITVSFRLEQERTVNLKAHDMQGKQVLNIFSNKKLNAGEYNEKLELKGLNPGMYYIVIETDKGEQALQRVIIER